MTNGNNQQDGDDFHIESYRAALESKHHYDTLSWTVGGATFVFVAAGLAYIPTITTDGYWWSVALRLPTATFVIVLLLAWQRVYERNRLWGEVANAFMQRAERARSVEGIAIAFMKASHDRGVLLENTDEAGRPHKGMSPRFERSTAGPMHNTVRGIVCITIVLVLFACFFAIPKQAKPSAEASVEATGLEKNIVRMLAEATQ